ncbi:MAG: glycosyltransferase [Bryobacterales bacterium]|nr:glycosyltransferase [Bryobacterales bacterium]
MPGETPRIAYFADCFDEVNGVALTTRQFTGYARRRQLPLLLVRAASRPAEPAGGCLLLRRSRLAVTVDPDLDFDLLFLRHLRRVERAVGEFAPDFIHVTSPGDVGLLGALCSHRLGIPLSAAWHTNLHEFGAWRLSRMLSGLPSRVRPSPGWLQRWLERAALAFYRRAKVLFAPNPELVTFLERATGRKVHRMIRGVDTSLFHPGRRRRSDDVLWLGYVGRLMPEKNVRLLARVDEALARARVADYHLLIAGLGRERRWLQSRLPRAEFYGILSPERLARLYADLDLFLFPSRTDTYGNVVQEALASGTPVIVTDGGGPKFIVTEGVNALVARTDGEFIECVLRAAGDRRLLERLKAGARAWQAPSWEAVFEGMYAAWRQASK